MRNNYYNNKNCKIFIYSNSFLRFILSLIFRNWIHCKIKKFLNILTLLSLPVQVWYFFFFFESDKLRWIRIILGCVFKLSSLHVSRPQRWDKRGRKGRQARSHETRKEKGGEEGKNEFSLVWLRMLQRAGVILPKRSFGRNYIRRLCDERRWRWSRNRLRLAILLLLLLLLSCLFRRSPVAFISISLVI